MKRLAPAELRGTVRAGILLGAGLGGFVDGIVLHQILQWHNMLSNVHPPDTLVGAKVNMTWDGFFHAGVWALTLLGVVQLHRAGPESRTPGAGRTLAGAMLFGWGVFNLVEGVLDHHVLKLHNVLERADARTQELANFAFLLGPGLALTAIGWALIRQRG